MFCKKTCRHRVHSHYLLPPHPRLLPKNQGGIWTYRSFHDLAELPSARLDDRLEVLQSLLRLSLYAALDLNQIREDKTTPSRKMLRGALTSLPVDGSKPREPEQNSKLPTLIAWLEGPTAAGAPARKGIVW